MKKEYDFTKGERGKFFSKETKLNMPVYLDADILDYLSAKAKAKGVDIDDVVNDLLRKDIELIEGMK